ncbi:hypothetical protein Tco_1229481 [Tanacetum coccineum]
MKGVGKELSKYLSDFQFGVEVPGGTEAILHSANRLLSEYHNDGSLAMLTMDFSNAFNLVDRSRYSTRQLQASSFNACYLNDETVIGDSEEVARVLDIIKVSGPGLGLEPNIKKTKIFWPSCNGVKLCEGLFPIDIRRPSLGVKLLGGVGKGLVEWQDWPFKLYRVIAWLVLAWHVLTIQPITISNDHYLMDHVLVPLTEGRAHPFMVDGKRLHPQTSSGSSSCPSPTPTQGEINPVDNFTLDPVMYIDQLPPILKGASKEFNKQKNVQVLRSFPFQLWEEEKAVVC